MSQRLILEVRDIERPEKATLTINGRDAWALRELANAGKNGCTPIDNPAPRWSGYVHKLRRMGFNIVTVCERHDGPFAGTHARYVLMDKIELRDPKPDGQQSLIGAKR